MSNASPGWGRVLIRFLWVLNIWVKDPRRPIVQQQQNLECKNICVYLRLSAVKKITSLILGVIFPLQIIRSKKI